MENGLKVSGTNKFKVLSHNSHHLDKAKLDPFVTLRFDLVAKVDEEAMKMTFNDLIKSYLKQNDIKEDIIDLEILYTTSMAIYKKEDENFKQDWRTFVIEEVLPPLSSLVAKQLLLEEMREDL